MGQTLSSPVTTVTTDSGSDERFAYAVSEMQGWRVSMEDSHTTILKLNDEAPNEETDAFFAVFDGHGGASVAKYAGDNVYRRLSKEESYQERQYERALKRSFMGTDEDLRADPAFFRDPSGCTAVAALITHDSRIFVANAGDSRSVLCVAGEAKPLSYDHKPDNMVEYNRIKSAGGYIEGGRVCGNLSLSRAIGDFEFKKDYSLEPEKQIITSNPDIMEHPISEEDEFLVIACDGIWDCLTSQECCDYIRRSLQQDKKLPEICEAMMQHCLSPDSNGGIGMDNMTVLIVAILHGRTLDEWYQWVKQRVESKIGYETPQEFHSIYSYARLKQAEERQKRQKYNQEHPRDNIDDDDDDDDDNVGHGSMFRPVGLGSLGLSRILGVGQDGGVGSSFGPMLNKIAMFADPEDSEESDSDDDLRKWNAGEYDGEGEGHGVGGSIGVGTLAGVLQIGGVKNGMGHLEEENEEDHHMLIDDEDYQREEVHSFGRRAFGTNPNANHLQGEAPPSPAPPPGASKDSSTFVPRQLPPRLPDGDASRSRTMPGTLDSSEDPLLAATRGT